MAAEAETTPNTSEDLECPICHEDFDTPKLLPCNHLACKKCILSWMQKGGGHAGCPLCRKPVLPPTSKDEGDLATLVDALPTHLAKVALIEGRQLLQGSADCSLCEDNVAASYCLQCGVKLCKPCLKGHKRLPSTMYHTIETLDKVTLEQVTETNRSMCKVHPGRLAELFCSLHEELICILCGSTSHEKCSGKKTVEDAGPEHRAQLKEKSQELRWREMSICIKRKKVKDNFSTMRRKVKDTIDDLHQRLENRREQLNMKIQQAEDSYVTALQEMETAQAALASNAATVENLVVTAPDAALLAMLRDLMSRLNDLDLSTVTVESVELEEFTVDLRLLEQLENLIPNLGRVILTPKPAKALRRMKPTGEALARTLKVGDRVKIAPGWQWVNSWGEHGIVTAIPSQVSANCHCVDVRWDYDPKTHVYWMGYKGKYQLELV